MSILIRNVFLITQDERRQRFFGDIYIEDDMINEISKQPLSLEAERIIDGSNKLAIPGLINTHTHIPMALLRGYGDDMILQEWLEQCIWPIEAKLTQKTIQAGTNLALLEMVASGTTTFLDMYFYEDVIASLASKIGIRAALGFAFIDHGTPEFGYDELFTACNQFVSKWKNNTLVTPVLAPHGVYTCSPDTLFKIKDIAERHHLLIHTHCSETRDEVYNAERTLGNRPIAQLIKTGILSDNMILAHCCWITKQEISDISKAKASVSHCPVSNMKIATGGYAPVPEMLDANIAVSLGTDGAASNNTLDMFETMKFCALVHKQHRWDPKILPAQTVLDMATRHAAHALHMQETIGSLEVGKKADIVLIDLHSPHLTPCHDPVSHLIYAVNGSDICTTIINGRLIMYDKTFLTLDTTKILTEATNAAKVLTNKT